MKNYFKRFRENAMQFLGFDEKFKIYGFARNDYWKMKTKWIVLLLTEGCSAEDYFAYCFYNKSYAERKEYVTLLRGSYIIKKLNGNGNRNLVEDKAVFYQYFKDYLYRKCMPSKNLGYREFAEVVRGG